MALARHTTWLKRNRTPYREFPCCDMNTTADLFDFLPDVRPCEESLAPGALLLRGLAGGAIGARLLEGVATVLAHAPLRQMTTPGGLQMSVSMTNCGPLGWISDRRGYRYEALDPLAGRPWPPLPEALRELAVDAAGRAGYPGFEPDSCLVNRYVPGTRLSLHQDRNERDFDAPIVSVSLGLPAVFLFGGLERRDRPRRWRLEHGDVVVWGGVSRLAFHGVAPLADGEHPATGAVRINLTLRRAS
jgi:alkylated DNA repair protein (DNA oxidative demethylase)